MIKITEFMILIHNKKKGKNPSPTLGSVWFNGREVF